jgi:hypothetical protein
MFDDVDMNMLERSLSPQKQEKNRILHSGDGETKVDVTNKLQDTSARFSCFHSFFSFVFVQVAIDPVVFG